MAASKAKVIEKLAGVKNLGTAYATKAYEDLKVRSIDDLIEAAKANKLQTIKGIGAAKEKAILAAAQDLQKSADKPAPTPSKPKTSSKAKGGAKAKGGKKADSKAKKDEPKKSSKPKAKADKKAEKPAEKAEKPAAKAKPEPKPEKKETPKPAASKSDRPRTTYRPPEPKPRPSIPGLIFKLTKKIIGRILS